MDILIRPIVTEKMERLTSKVNQYGFIVEKKANKLQIKRAIEDLYGVTVDSVNTIRYDGKVKTRYTKAGFLVGRTNSFKKALVTLKNGEKIDFYSNI
ncbi:MAG: 50S ribosomal protein L23 [Bacteroidales bacterium]|nr:50S ribosomal protein L23 [Bacteroidales bacterium]